MTGARKRILLAFLWYTESLHEGALRYCMERGWDAVLLNADSVALHPPGSYDGILCMLPPAGHPVHAFVAGANVPVVELSYSHPENTAWGRCPIDGVAAGRLAADFLRRRPVKSFVFTAFAAWPQHDARWDGFRAGLSKDLRPCVRFDVGVAERPDCVTLLDTGVREEAMISRLAEFLKTRPAPVGIFGAVDPLARIALDAARMAGLEVPGGAYVLGFGNRDLVSRVAPVPISSIGVNYAGWAYAAMDLLEGMISGAAPKGTLRAFPPEGVVERASTGGESGGDPLCARVLAIMHEHVSGPLSVAELASRTGVSKSTLNRVFTEAYGIGVAAKYLALRLEVAKALLEAGDKVDGVSSAVGFASVRAFRSAFRKVHGCAPGDYARRR